MLLIKYQRMKDQKLQILHYKNALFQGYVSKPRKEGNAIALLDNGAVIVGQFQADQLSGQSLLMIYPDTYFMGTFKKGMLDGPFVMRSPRYSIYSQAVMNKIQGEIVVVDRSDRRARVWQIENSEGVCIREGQYDQFYSEEKIMRAIAPYAQEFPGLLQYFVLDVSSRFSVKAMGKDELQLTMDVKATRKLTLQFRQERLMAAGLMEHGLIYGLGYFYSQSSQTEIEGQIDKNQLHGEGLKRQLTTGKSIFGKFAHGDIRSLDVVTEKAESANSSLDQLKKRIHMHSLEFINDYINQRPVLLIRNLYESVTENDRSYTKFQREQGMGRPAEMGETGLRKGQSSEQLTYNINEYNVITSALRNNK